MRYQVIYLYAYIYPYGMFTFGIHISSLSLDNLQVTCNISFAFSAYFQESTLTTLYKYNTQ